MSFKKLSGAGFTLVEVLIVLFLVTLMASFLFSTFNFILTDYASMFEESKITQDAFNAMDIMSRDLKMASRATISDANWPDQATGYKGGLNFYADLDNNGTAEEYTYYLYHPDEVMGDPTFDRTYLTQPSHDKFYRLYRFRGAPAEVVTNYLGHPGILLADDVVPPVVYENKTGSHFAFDPATGKITIRLNLQKEKESVVKEKVILETDIYARNE